MKPSKTLSYAIKALAILAGEDARRPVPCRVLAERGEIPERFLLQILRALVHKGILKSTRGVVGGYSLARPDYEVCLLEIVEAIDGRLSFELDDCQPLSEPLAETLIVVTQRMRDQLAAVSLADVAVRSAERRPLPTVEPQVTAPGLVA